MVMRMNKKIVSVKDVPSNLIEEAIFILKSDMDDEKNGKRAKLIKEIFLNDAEEIVNEYALNMELQRNTKQNTKEILLKQLKHEAIYLAGLFILMGICISTVI